MFKNERDICEFENCIDFFEDTNVKNLTDRVENLLHCVLHKAEEQGLEVEFYSYCKQFGISNFRVPSTITHKGLYKLFKQFSDYTNN